MFTSVTILGALPICLSEIDLNFFDLMLLKSLTLSPRTFIHKLEFL